MKLLKLISLNKRNKLNSQNSNLYSQKPFPGEILSEAVFFLVF